MRILKKLVPVVFGILILCTPFFSYAQIPFGGKITFVRLCNAPPAVLITVGPPIPGDYMVLTPGTFIFRYGSFRVGAKVLGLMTPFPVTCFVGGFPAMVPIGAGSPVIMVGTSLPSLLFAD